METKQIPQICKDSIKEMVTQEANGQQTTIAQYINDMASCWKMDGFQSKQEAHESYTAYWISRQIRTWCRRNKYTTRKGSYHSFDGRQRENREIWRIVGGWMQNAECDNVEWNYRTVDSLKNIYIWFN